MGLCLNNIGCINIHNKEYLKAESLFKKAIEYNQAIEDKYNPNPDRNPKMSRTRSIENKDLEKFNDTQKIEGDAAELLAMNDLVKMSRLYQ
jgi:hypothetical protein